MSIEGIGQRVAVTGAAGFIGSHLVDELLARGHMVVGIDRVPQEVCGARNLDSVQHHPSLVLRVFDIATGPLSEALNGCDTVFHLAGRPGVRPSWGTEFSKYVSNNLLATQRVIDACEAARVRRLVFACTSSVYGNTEGPSKEQDIPAPLSPYAVTKLAAEQLCFAHVNRQGSRLTAVSIRYFSVYGPRQRPDMAVQRLLSASLRGKVFTVYGNGQQRRDFTYVADAVEATIAAASVEAAWQIVNVGGGACTSLLDLIAMQEAITGRRVVIKYATQSPGDVESTFADLNHAHALLSYVPKVSLADGLAAQFRWLTSTGAPALNDAARKAGYPNLV